MPFLHLEVSSVLGAISSKEIALTSPVQFREIWKCAGSECLWKIETIDSYDKVYFRIFNNKYKFEEAVKNDILIALGGASLTL